MVSPALTLLAANDFLLPVSLLIWCKHLAIWCSPHIASTTEHNMFSWSEYHRRMVFYYILWDIQGMLVRGEEENERFMKLPLKVNTGFMLRLLCCEDLHLISFRCWLEFGFGRAHTFLLSVITVASIGLAWRNRAAFVPTCRLASCGGLQQLADNTQPVLIQMEKLIYN